MDDLLRAQYALTQSARGVLLDYCASLTPAHLVAPLPAFNNSSIRDLLVHMANTYYHWLGVVARQLPPRYFEPAAVPDVAALRTCFARVDELVTEFLARAAGHEQQAEWLTVTRRPEPLPLTPLQLFTHVLTHEFHHKGQVLSMSRQLGYLPVDTDVIRT
ncbi:DinB family protein [Hymenobacter sp. 15J16-1T3B]|uniref:DinB family protein n=1 Tax=Hymenobacter sp. 15J16-1T3B TaxID=2886941 RepID=UPI001D0FCD5E|nr:DinB family protein [Hymenobacter sp. 15J16-1T3B]MCC3157499.1 DinB family protein [Hymenobacter sp. 15J16-1T3B]